MIWAQSFWLIHVALGCVPAWIQVVCWDIDLSISLENFFGWYKYLHLNNQSYLLIKLKIWIVVLVGNFWAKRCLNGLPCPGNAILGDKKISLALPLFVQATTPHPAHLKLIQRLFSSYINLLFYPESNRPRASERISCWSPSRVTHGHRVWTDFHCHIEYYSCWTYISSRCSFGCSLWLVLTGPLALMNSMHIFLSEKLFSFYCFNRLVPLCSSFWYQFVC